MARIYPGTDEQWDRIESPLRVLDPVLEAFAKEHDLALIQNESDWPGRSLVWGSPVERKIQVVLHDESLCTYHFWIMMWEQRPEGRFWKRESIANSLTADEIEQKLTQFLAESFTTLQSWTDADLGRAH